MPERGGKVQACSGEGEHAEGMPGKRGSCVLLRNKGMVLLKIFFIGQKAEKLWHFYSDTYKNKTKNFSDRTNIPISRPVEEV